MTCPKCLQAMAPIGEVSADYAGTDERLIRFSEQARDRGHTGRWRILECANADCGCDCRRYVPCR